MTSEEDVPDAWNRRHRPPRHAEGPLHRSQGQRAAGSLLAAHAESAMADSACGVPKRCLWTPLFIQKFWYGSCGWAVGVYLGTGRPKPFLPRFSHEVFPGPPVSPDVVEICGPFQGMGFQGLGPASDAPVCLFRGIHHDPTGPWTPSRKFQRRACSKKRLVTRKGVFNVRHKKTLVTFCATNLGLRD